MYRDTVGECSAILTPGKAPGGAEVGVISESAVKRQQTDAVVHENTRLKHTTDARRLETQR